MGSTSSQALSGDDSNAAIDFGRATRNSTWLLSCMLVVFMAIMVVLFLLQILGASVGEAFKFMFMVCCSQRAMKVAPADDVEQDTVLIWEAVAPHIESTQPPASYRPDRSPSFREIGAYLRASLHGDSQSS